MEGGRKRKASNIAMEENITAILDVFGAGDSSHLNADRIRFLEAVRSSCIIPVDGPPPTNKMLEAVFRIFRDSKCLELVMASYQLLIDLDKCFPQVHLPDKYEGKSSSLKPSESDLVFSGEVWSPFDFGLDAVSSSESKKKNVGRLNQSDFYHLLQSLAELASQTDVDSLDIKVFCKMLLFKYLISVIEGDFRARVDTRNWTFLRKSNLSLLLGSRRINYKELVKICISLMSRSGFDFIEKPLEDPIAENCDKALALALPEMRKDTFAAAKKLVLMMMELDSLKKTADLGSLTSRADGVRTPVMEIIQDELTYNKDIISSFLQAVDEPTWKLKIILNHIQKYMPSSRTRSSDGSKDDPTLKGVLKLFSDSNNAKTMVKKIGTEVMQILLSHAFQAGISLTHEQLLDEMSFSKETSGSPLSELCNIIVSAFRCLRSTDVHIEILPVSKEAIVTAAALLTLKS